MKALLYITTILCAISLSSCGGWLKNQEEGYMMACEKNMASRLEFYGQAEKAKDVCACSLNKVKEKWTYDEFLDKVEDPEVIQIMQDCIKSVTGIDETQSE